MVKYKELFFWKNFINAIKSLNNANYDNGMFVEENDF